MRDMTVLTAVVTAVVTAAVKLFLVNMLLLLSLFLLIPVLEVSDAALKVAIILA